MEVLFSWKKFLTVVTIRFDSLVHGLRNILKFHASQNLEQV
jgi:hypothetical protein